MSGMNGAQEIKFWDGSKRRNWFVVRSIVRKIAERPQLLDEIGTWVDANWTIDPSKKRSLGIWRDFAILSPIEFGCAILADNPRAQEARENFPSCVALTAREMVAVMDESRNEEALA